MLKNIIRRSERVGTVNAELPQLDIWFLAQNDGRMAAIETHLVVLIGQLRVFCRKTVIKELGAYRVFIDFFELFKQLRVETVLDGVLATPL